MFFQVPFWWAYIQWESDYIRRALRQGYTCLQITAGTARETIFSFSGRPEKMVFPKKLRWNMIFLVLLGKMIFLFPANMTLHVRQKMKDDLSVKIHGNTVFSSNFLKIWSFQKVPRRQMIFLVLSGKMVFFSRKHDLFSLGRK